jgi:hypothetical protein
MKIRFGSVSIFVLLASGFSLNAQSTNTQVWFECMLNHPFGKSFNIENAFTYSTLLNTPRWRSFDFSPTLEYSLNNHVDFTLGATFSGTAQTDDYNTFEVRPVAGTRLHITPNRRILIRTYLRLEQRNFLNLESDEWESVIRPRFRLEFVMPLNKKRYAEDNLWYGILDGEWLYAVDDVEERFANRFRTRIGLGYRLSYASRFEFVYMNQQSKNAMDETFSSVDNVFRFRYKHFLGKKKTTNLSGTGN